MPRLTHVDTSGQATMVDISDKAETNRLAIAGATVQMSAETMKLIAENKVAKGDVLSVARVAGIMAAKKTADLIPLCHSLQLSSLTIEFSLHADTSTLEITATAKVRGPTGVEMEALTAVSVAALTIYDMCKAVDRGMRINDIRLIHKTGGKSGTWSLP